MTKLENFNTLCDEYWQFVCETEPLKAVMAGIETKETLLFKVSLQDFANRYERAGKFLSRLNRINPEQFDTTAQTSYSLLLHELEVIRLQYEVKNHLRPSLFPMGPDLMLKYAAELTVLTSVAKTQVYLEQLLAIPKAISGLQQSLTAGRDHGMYYPKLVVEGAIANGRGFFGTKAKDSFLYTPFKNLQNQSPALQDLADKAVQALEQLVIPALLGYVDFLEIEILPWARDSIAVTDGPSGAEFYQALIKEYVSQEMDPGQIHQTGLTEVARIKNEMEIVAENAGFNGDLEGYRHHLMADKSQYLSSAKTLREAIQILSKQIDGLIPEYFGFIPRITYGVKTIPKQVAANLPVAYAQPGPGDNSTAGVHWITSLPDRCPKYMHIPLALHEAWPGHLMHLAMIQDLEDLPDFRRYGGMNYSVCLEGWALYCEELGVDMGLYNEPYKEQGRLEMEMWRAVRLVVDTGIHTKGWTRKQAIDYTRANLSMPDTTIEAEIDRYIGMPAQALSYQLGKIKIRDMKNAAITALRDRFNLKDFHGAFLRLGAVSLPMIEHSLTEWMDKKIKKEIDKSIMKLL